MTAHLVEYCLENQIEYCWEATNKASIAVAKKLGFVEDGQMIVYQHQHKELGPQSTERCH